MTETTSNRQLALRVAGVAARADPGTLTRRGAACASVALAETRSVEAARRYLDAGGLHDGIRRAAHDVLDHLASQPEE